MKSKLTIFVLIVVLTILTAIPATAAPLVGPCAPGTAYDPACDVDQDGDVDIFDIQLTASRWNRTGTWVSDNDHDHLGQTWVGNNNPLRIQGNFGPPNEAPLVLSNSTSTGAGLLVSSAGSTGVSVNSAGNDGLSVGSAGDDGLSVSFPGDDGVSVLSAGGDGFDVQSAGGHGLSVGSSFGDGVHVESASGDGIFVCRAGLVASCTPSGTSHGLEIGDAQSDGVRITDAEGDGIQIGDGTRFPLTGLRIPSPGTPGDALLPNTSDASGQWALFTTDDIQAGNVFASAHTLIAIVGGDQPLGLGDVVAATGLADPIPGGRDHLAEVRPATAEQSGIAGVVHSRLVLRPIPGSAGDAEAGEQDLRSVDGPALPGDYVAIIVLGAAQVKVDSATPIEAGQRLTIAVNGRARPLGTIKVQLAGGEGTADIAESAPVIGVTLEAAKDELVWVLVNP